MKPRPGPSPARNRAPRAAVALWALLAMCSASGANCHRFFAQWPTPVAPRVLPENPTLDDVVRVVNDNADRVQTLTTQQATLEIPGLPTLRTRLDVDRPHRFRLVGSVLGSEEVDLGGNEERFWIWIKRNDPPAMYYCSHEDFHASAARRILPIEPEWLIEALGLVHLDPQAPHRGPFQTGNGRLEIHTPSETPTGPVLKVLVVDAASGVVLEQKVVDAHGRVLGTAVASRHGADPATGALLPGRVNVALAATENGPGLTMQFTLKNVQVNRAGGISPDRWEMPAQRGYAAVDLGSQE